MGQAQVVRQLGRKKCKSCQALFLPFNSMQVVCGKISCAVEWSKTKAAKDHTAKAKRVEKIQSRQKFADSDRGHWVKKLDVVFNAFVRLRDAGLPCISCGTSTGQMQAGHYRPKGGHGHLRWHEDNVHAQCSTCNNYRSGNLTAYRPGLISKVGQEAIDWLEGPHDIKKTPQIEEIKGLIVIYKAKLAGLKNK